MIYRIPPIGCFLAVLIFTYLFFELKLYIPIFALFLFLFLWQIFKTAEFKIKNVKKEKERQYKPKPGETYKICPVCGNELPSNAKICPHCNYEYYK